MDEFGGDRADDVVEQGGDRPPGRLTGLIAGRSRRPGWRPSRGAAVLAAIALVAGLAVGYGAGRSAGGPQAGTGSGSANSSPSPRASAVPVTPGQQLPVPSAAGVPVLTQAIGACSAQVGRDLQLGVQVANLTGGQVTLRRVVADLPMGGLKMISQQWEPCGGLPTGYYDTGDVVGPSSTSWFSVTFRVLVKCPGPYPVQFTVEYDFGGHTSAVQLPGFADLSQVSYTGCPAQ